MGTTSKEDMDAMAIMTGIAELDTSSAVGIEQETKAQPKEPPTKPNHKRPSRRKQRPVEKQDPQNAVIRVSNQVFAKFKLLKHVETLLSDQPVTASSLLDILLSEHISKLPTKQREAFEALCMETD